MSNHRNQKDMPPFTAFKSSLDFILVECCYFFIHLLLLFFRQIKCTKTMAVASGTADVACPNNKNSDKNGHVRKFD